MPSQRYARGIDMATDSSDVAAQLQGRHWLDFVARYYRDPASRWPALSLSEAQRLSALGVKIVTVWEWHSSDPGYFTYATGYNDALSAVRQAKAVGQPPGSAIYFAVDFNARGSAMLAVDQYFRGINAGLAAAGRGRPEYRVGVYGSGAVCAAVRGSGLAQYAWLSGSTAWDGTAGYNDWNIRQAAQGARFANLSFSHDANEARSDYGGFQIGNYAKAAPPTVEPVMAVANAAPVAAATLVSSAVASMAPRPAAPAPAAPP
ncbi:MAG TPA: glycoside hydrolase domain-containing protein, partial [Stellaceae bacterium]|nr:glycoside hydrolase domain-containing protein [Stellaceae bacterium]